MKKANVILVTMCLLGIWVTSCVKENEKENAVVKKIEHTTTAKVLKRLKTVGFEGSYSIFGKVGHKSADCGGKCKYLNGNYCHIDCQGYGNICTLSASINITKNFPEDYKDIYYTGKGIYDYEPSTEETFTMPARSFYIENNNFENGYIWLNIPAQEIIRDQDNSFIYCNISFTVNALFENL